jgi:AAA family ATP:ADP antiporter
MEGRPRRNNRFLALLHKDPAMAACWWRTFFPSLSLFLITAAFIVTKTGRDALFFQKDGLGNLPYAYLLIALLSAPAAGAILWLMRICGPRAARIISLLMMAALQVLFFFVVRPGGGPSMTLFFVLIPLLYGVLLALAWLLGADLLEVAPSFVLARLYSTMGASSMTGGLAGAALSRNLAHRLEPESFLLIGAAGLVLAALINVLAHRSFPVIEIRRQNAVPAPEGGVMPPPAEMLGLFRHRYIMLLTAVGMIAALVGVFIEFQFYWSASAAGYSGRENLHLFANFYIVLNAAAVLLQVLGMPPLQRRIGVYGSLFVLPAVLIGASAVVLASANAMTRTGLRVAEGGVKSSIHRSNWEQSYLPLERAKRATAKLLVDGMAARIGEGAAAALLVLWLHMADRNPMWMTWIPFAGSVLWFLLTFALRRSREGSGLVPDEEVVYRSDLPIPDG